MTDLAPILRMSLGPWAEHAEALASVLEHAGHGIEACEASFRGPSVVGTRMMIEHVDAATAEAVLSLLGVSLPAAARGLPHPYIVGWDAAGPKAKLYLNLSDAAASVRSAIAASLDVPGAPHVIGVNFGTTDEWKVYQQADALDAAAPAALHAWTAEVPVAGAITCFDVDRSAGTTRARAFFVGPRDDGPLEDALRRLPGWSDDAARDALPFAPGLVKSVGFSADGATWTVYVKPRSYEGSLWSLEPSFCLARDDVQLGIFLAPGDPTRKAYAHTQTHAVSYRVRAGKPERALIDGAMQWVVERVRDLEAQGTLVLDDPPDGWHVVAA